MSWKKAVFFGGALLVLAACGDATAPTSPSALRRVDGNSAALTAGVPTSTVGLPVSGTMPVLGSPTTIVCINILVHVGPDGEIISTECAPSPDQ